MQFSYLRLGRSPKVSLPREDFLAEWPGCRGAGKHLARPGTRFEILGGQ
jgi:hypothetical protein